jgi:hypothetical protein
MLRSNSGLAAGGSASGDDALRHGRLQKQLAGRGGERAGGRA